MRIAWLSTARDDLNEAVDYVLQDNPAAARRLIEAIRTHVDLLAEQPGLGRPGRVPGTRELVIPRTPYLVAYTVDAAAQTVVILRVLHGEVVGGCAGSAAARRAEAVPGRRARG